MKTPIMCSSSLRKTMTPNLRPHISIGQPEPKLHPSLCPKIPEKKACLKMWGQHLILVSQVVMRKPVDTRLGRPSGVGGAERATASLGWQTWGSNIHPLPMVCWALWYLFPHLIPHPGWGEARIKINQDDSKIHVFIRSAWCPWEKSETRDQKETLRASLEVSLRQRPQPLVEPLTLGMVGTSRIQPTLFEKFSG